MLMMASMCSRSWYVEKKLDQHIQEMNEQNHVNEWHEVLYDLHVHLFV